MAIRAQLALVAVAALAVALAPSTATAAAFNLHNRNCAGQACLTPPMHPEALQGKLVSPKTVGTPLIASDVPIGVSRDSEPSNQVVSRTTALASNIKGTITPLYPDQEKSHGQQGQGPAPSSSSSSSSSSSAGSTPLSADPYDVSEALDDSTFVHSALDELLTRMREAWTNSDDPTIKGAASVLARLEDIEREINDKIKQDAASVANGEGPALHEAQQLAMAEEEADRMFEKQLEVLERRSTSEDVHKYRSILLGHAFLEYAVNKALLLKESGGAVESWLEMEEGELISEAQLIHEYLREAQDLWLQDMLDKATEDNKALVMQLQDENNKQLEIDTRLAMDAELIEQALDSSAVEDAQSQQARYKEKHIAEQEVLQQLVTAAGQNGAVMDALNKYKAAIRGHIWVQDLVAQLLGHVQPRTHTVDHDAEERLVGEAQQQQQQQQQQQEQGPAGQDLATQQAELAAQQVKQAQQRVVDAEQAAQQEDHGETVFQAEQALARVQDAQEIARVLLSSAVAGAASEAARQSMQLADAAEKRARELLQRAETALGWHRPQEPADPEDGHAHEESPAAAAEPASASLHSLRHLVGQIGALPDDSLARAQRAAQQAQSAKESKDEARQQEKEPSRAVFKAEQAKAKATVAKEQAEDVLQAATATGEAHAVAQTAKDKAEEVLQDAEQQLQKLHEGEGEGGKSQATPTHATHAQEKEAVAGELLEDALNEEEEAKVAENDDNHKEAEEKALEAEADAAAAGETAAEAQSEEDAIDEDKEVATQEEEGSKKVNDKAEDTEQEAKKKTTKKQKGEIAATLETKARQQAKNARRKIKENEPQEAEGVAKSAKKKASKAEEEAEAAGGAVAKKVKKKASSDEEEAEQASGEAKAVEYSASGSLGDAFRKFTALRRKNLIGRLSRY